MRACSKQAASDRPRLLKRMRRACRIVVQRTNDRESEGRQVAQENNVLTGGNLEW